MPCGVASAFREELEVDVGFTPCLVRIIGRLAEGVFDAEFVVGVLVIHLEGLDIVEKGILECVSDFDVLVEHEVWVAVKHPVGVGADGGPSGIEVFGEGEIAAEMSVGVAFDLDALAHLVGVLGATEIIVSLPHGREEFDVEVVTFREFSLGGGVQEVSSEPDSVADVIDFTVGVEIEFFGSQKP